MYIPLIRGPWIAKSRVSKTPSKNSATSSPNLNVQPIRKRMTSKPSTLFVPIFLFECTLHPTGRRSTQSPRCQPRTPADASMRIHLCPGCIQGAVECPLEFANAVYEDVRTSLSLTGLSMSFGVAHSDSVSNRFLWSLPTDASNADKRDEAMAAYSTASSLGRTIPNTRVRTGEHDIETWLNP